MLALVQFDLKRIFQNRLFYFFAVLMFIGIFLFFHLDWLILPEETIIYVDSSIGPYQSTFLEIDSSLQYCLSDQENNIILHRENATWNIISSYELDAKTKSLIQQDIKKVVEKEFIGSHLFLQEYVNEMNQDIEFIYQAEQTIDHSISLLASIVFLLIINFASSLANEVIYEKGSKFIQVLFVYIDEKQYVLAKVLESFLTPFFQLLMLGIGFVLNVVIRFFQDGFVGLQRVWNVEQPAMECIIEIHWKQLLSIGFILLLSLVLIQLVIMFVVSRFQNAAQSSLLMGIVYVISLIAYFLFLMFIERLQGSQILIKVLSYLPIFSMLWMPVRILKGMSSMIPIVACIGVLVLTIYQTIKVGMKEYKENMVK